jgi:UMF1 family MFS transporter
MTRWPVGNDRRKVWSWALYDWANSAFATVVLVGFFPLLFRNYWSSGLADADANLRLGWANSLTSVIIILMAPLVGAVADKAGLRKVFLAAFATLGVVATALLARVPGGEWLPAAGLFVAATVGFMGANLFYDALLTSVAPSGRWHRVSAFGFALGYLGGGLLFLGCALAAMQPQRFGFGDPTEAALAGITATAIWWAVFALPLFRYVPEPPHTGERGWRALGQGWRQLRGTVTHLGRYRPILVFLIAYWLYIDGVHTVMRMAVAYGDSIGFEHSDLITALLVVQFVGFPAAIAYGYLGDRFGPRRGIYLGLGVYTGICGWGFFVDSVWEFYAIAVLVGLVQGGVQSLSRSFYARLIPPAESGEFFGFYNLLGKFATLIGPPLFGLFGYWFGDERYSIVSLILLFVAGGTVLGFVREQRSPGVAGGATAY